MMSHPPIPPFQRPARRARHARAATVLALLASVGGCSEAGSADRSDVTVRDSAGVRVVEYGPSVALEEVRLEEPVLRVGREGDPAYELFRARSVRGLASGNLVVANGGTHELRFYGPTGEHLRTVGGRGEGPGEFGFLSTMWLRPGDSLLVNDSRQRRLALFDSAGTFVGTESYASELGGEMAPGATSCVPTSMSGVLTSGALVLWGWVCLRLEGSDGWRWFSGTMALSRNEQVDTLGVFPLMEVWENADGATPAERSVNSPFARRVAWALHGDRVHLARPEARRIEVYGAAGTLEQVVADVSPLPRFTDEHRAAAEARRAEADSGEGATPGPPAAPMPEHLPPQGGLLVSHEGEVWLGHFVPPGDSVQTWVVHAPDGLPLRRVVLPADVEVHAVRDGRLYGLRQDDLGIQQVLVFDLAG